MKDGEDIMIDIYENVHDKLRFVERKLAKETEKVQNFLSAIFVYLSELFSSAYQTFV